MKTLKIINLHCRKIQVSLRPESFSGFVKLYSFIWGGDHLILHLELHFRASRCGGLPSSVSRTQPLFVPYSADRGRCVSRICVSRFL